MPPHPERSRLFHTIVVVGLSLASNDCGARTGDNLLVGALGEGSDPDSSTGDSAVLGFAAADVAAEGPSLLVGPPPSDTDAESEASSVPAADAATDAGFAPDACVTTCCVDGYRTVRQLCGTCTTPWPCYV
jgi:hypothetical protein